MPPHHLFGVVIAGHFGPFIRAALHFPYVLGFSDPQPHYATFSIELALGYLPVQAQSQQFMKQLFGCYTPSLPRLSTENSEEPICARLKAFADSLESRGKSKMSALIAVEHKLLRHAFAILKNKSTYDLTPHRLETL